MGGGQQGAVEGSVARSEPEVIHNDPTKDKFCKG